MKILDFGCGPNKTKRNGVEVVGVDIFPCEAVDVVHNLNNTPYPFSDDTFDEIICSDVLEHLNDVPAAMKEIHRISRSGAVIKIRSPHFSSPYWAMDPTHVRAFSVFSFDCFCVNKGIIPHNLNWNLFKIKKRKILFPKLIRTLGFFIDLLWNRFPLRYEQYFAFMCQAENIYLELETVK